MQLRSARPAAWLLLLLAAAGQMASGASIAKRSLSALARTSQLPHSSTAPADQSGHDQEHSSHGGQSPGQHDKRSELQEEAIREELLRQRAAPATEALLSAIMAAGQYGGDLNINGVEDKRSVSSLARYGNLPAPASPSEKRSLEALARSGLLNKNSRVDASKRGVSSLARAGELPGKRWMPPHQREQAQDLLDVLQRELEEEKRSLSSLARAGGLARPSGPDALPFPLSVAEQQVKRSLESLARNWNLPESAAAPKRSPPYGAFDVDADRYLWGKRNAAALLRQSKFSTGSDGATDDAQRDDESQHNQGRRKRSLWDEDAVGEVAAPYVQSAAAAAPEQDADWDAVPAMWAAYLAGYGGGGDDGALLPQKRFLGRIPNMGRHRQKTNEDSSPRRRRPH